MSDEPKSRALWRINAAMLLDDLYQHYCELCEDRKLAAVALVPQAEARLKFLIRVMKR